MRLPTKDYCPHCRGRTDHIKDWDGSMICRRCGRKDKAIKFQNFKL